MAEPEEGIEQLCFGLKHTLNGLHGKIVKIGLDATYNTNLSNLEFIQSDKYNIIAQFVHLNKDMAKIGMAKDIWTLAK
ncbi:hypothetical protein C8J56DRAFT_1065333 [Mycena floridula]|nr:hypothetical protein C8J56DRAFT_1065333 [Mycena floridula]